MTPQGAEGGAPGLGAKMLVVREAWKPGLDLRGKLGREAVERGLGHHQAFSGNALGIDDFVGIEDQAEVINHATFADEDGVIIGQMLGLHEQF